MACKVIVSAHAELDLCGIIDYLVYVLKQPSSAKSVLVGFEEITENLRRFPEMYPEVADARLKRKGYRKAALGNYVVLYRVESDAVAVVRIFHQRQDYAKLL